MFTHLNVHSHFSALRGVATQREILSRVREYGMSHLALTETNGLWGFVRFIQQARVAKIKAIAGVNIITQRDEAILLAENQTGYENICRIISAVHDDNTTGIRDLIHNRSAGVFMLSHRENTLRELVPIIPNSHLFIELRPGVEERTAIRLARELKLEIIATGDVYFLNPDDYTAHHILRAIYHNTTLQQVDPGDIKSAAHWLRSEKDMVTLFPNSLEAFNNSFYLAERCQTEWSFINTVFPQRSLKDTHRANRRLKALVYQGARQRYSSLSEEITRRIEYELRLIAQKGFAPYFLIVQDIVKQTRATIGRGSGAASIVSYCLFITQVDPLRHTLQFERFIHPERENMPDIDVDFPWDERDNILEYIFNKYGRDRSAMVANQVFLRARSAIREVAKVYGLSNEEIKSITKRVGYYQRRRDLLRWVSTDPRFSHTNLDDTLKNVLRQSEKIIDVFRNPSVHPGGVIIVPDEIRKYVPVLQAPKGVQIVEWEKDQVEDSGLLKIDILGNRSLAVARDTIRQINLNYGTESTNQYMDYHQIQPVGDPQTIALMASGHTMGVFYIESPATRQLLAKARIVDFEHVVIYSSIIRPAANRFINMMLERIHGKPWKSLHPDLKFLDESYGIMVYEEQVATTARIMAGFGYAEAEALRKTMSRDSLQHLIPGWKTKFFRAARRRGYSEALIRTVWDMIASFVGYSFCKPHSASYAMLSFTCAYLKAHYPAEFLAAVITNQGGFYSTYAYLSEARRRGITILLPDINRSQREYLGRKQKIRMGFMAIKHLQDKTIRSILEERKVREFTSLEDFFTRLNPDLSDAMALANAGCFSTLEPQRKHKEIAYLVAHYCLQNVPGDPLREPPVREPLSAAERHRMELETFGFPVTQHPLAPYRRQLRGHVIAAKDIPRYVGQTVRLAGVYITRKVTQTRRHDPMEFLTLEDETDLYECVLFPSAFRKYGDLLNWESLFLLRGKVEESFGVCTVTISELRSLSGHRKEGSPESGRHTILEMETGKAVQEKTVLERE